MKEENKCAATSSQEKYFLNTFPLIRHLIIRKLGVLNREAGEDLFQTVALRLWQWMTRCQTERQLSAEEWQRYANRTTCNEISRFYSSKLRTEISLSEIVEDYEFISIGGAVEVAGNTDWEACSSLTHWWEIIQKFSLREKYALLLQKQDFIFELIAARCCSLAEIAESLALSREELLTLLGKQPLSEQDVLRLIEMKTGARITVRQMWMARGKAKAKLKAVRRDLKQPITRRDKI